MPRVLTTHAIITCPHGGLGTTAPLVRPAWWNVEGGDVALEGDPGGIVCPFVLMPCIGYRLQSMGLNASTVGGRRVILETDFQQSLTGLPLLIVETHHVFDDSTPTPLPPGASQPLPPELTDTVRPTVTATPAAPVPVVKSTVAAPLVLSYALASPFPSRWQLTWLDLVTGAHTDLTNGVPPGVTVAPAGGAWDSSPATVSVTLSVPFQQALPVTVAGKNQRFVLTAISRRGLWGSAEVILNVSL